VSRFRFTAAASQDLREIVEYLAAEGSPEVARRFVQGLTERCQSLADMPGMGRRREELSPGLRSVPEGNYVVFYRPAEDGVQIVRVLHGARDIERIFTEEGS
jgi:toxin ParE1/3/4